MLVRPTRACCSTLLAALALPVVVAASACAPETNGDLDPARTDGTTTPVDGDDDKSSSGSPGSSGSSGSSGSVVADGGADAAPPTPNSGYPRPFAATSSWNTPVPANASYSKLGWPAPTGYNYWVNWDQYTAAIHISKPSDPLVQVKMPSSWGYPAQTLGIHVPAGVTGAKGTDGEILVIDGAMVHNMWQFKRESATAGSCTAYGVADTVNGSGWGTKNPFKGAGIVAAGASQLAGLLVQAETDAGEIEHALQIVLDAPLQKPGAVGEAINSDGKSPGGIGQEGERYAIPRGAAMPAGLSPLGQKVFRAFQKYGVFNIDVAYGVTTLRAQANAYDGATIDALRKDMSKLIPSLEKVTF